MRSSEKHPVVFLSLFICAALVTPGMANADPIMGKILSACDMSGTSGTAFALYVGNTDGVNIDEYDICCRDGTLPTGNISTTAQKCAVPHRYSYRGMAIPTDSSAREAHFAKAVLCASTTPFVVRCPDGRVPTCNTDVRLAQCESVAGTPPQTEAQLLGDSAAAADPAEGSILISADLPSIIAFADSLVPAMPSATPVPTPAASELRPTATPVVATSSDAVAGEAPLFEFSDPTEVAPVFTPAATDSLPPFEELILDAASSSDPSLTPTIPDELIAVPVGPPTSNLNICMRLAYRIVSRSSGSYTTLNGAEVLYKIAAAAACCAKPPGVDFKSVAQNACNRFFPARQRASRYAWYACVTYATAVELTCNSTDPLGGVTKAVNAMARVTRLWRYRVVSGIRTFLPLL